MVDAMRAHGLSNPEIRTELHSLWPELNGRPEALVAAGESERVLDTIPARFGDRLPAQPAELPTDLVAALRTLAAAAIASADALAREAS